MSEEKKKDADKKEAKHEKKETKAEEKAEEKPTTKADSGAKKVNYVYGALLLHSAGRPVDEASLKKVVEAAGEHPDTAQVKALVSSLEGVDIDDAIKSAAVPMAAAPAAPGAASDAAADAKKEEKPEDAEKKAEEAAAGLSSLFG